MFGIQIWLCHSLDFCCGNKQRILIESVKSWTARRSNQPVLKEINPQYSLECLILKLKLQYFGHLMRKRPWCWERLKVGGKGDDRGWDGWMASPTWWTWDWVSSLTWDWVRELAMDREAWRAVVHGITKNWTLLSYWTELNWWSLHGLTTTDFSNYLVSNHYGSCSLHWRHWPSFCSVFRYMSFSYMSSAHSLWKISFLTQLTSTHPSDLSSRSQYFSGVFLPAFPLGWAELQDDS